MEWQRTFDADQFDVPELDRRIWVASGIALLALGGALAILTVHRSPDRMSLLYLTSAGLGAGGVACVGRVTRITINRTLGTVTKRWGLFVPRHEEVVTVEPQAIRVVLDHEDDHDGQGWYRNTVLLVHSKGEVPLRTTRFSLGGLRRISEDLARFLNVELYEDRAYRLAGAFVPQSGTGTEPGRTYIIRKDAAEFS